MKNEMAGTGKSEGKAGVMTATLPWWARILMAQHSDAAFSKVAPHDSPFCRDFGCVLISADSGAFYQKQEVSHESDETV